MIDHIYTYIGIKIKHLREEMGLSQREFGAIIGLSLNTMVNLEGGRSPIHIKPLYELAAKLDIPIFELLPTMEQLQAWDVLEPVKRRGPGRPRAYNSVCSAEGCKRPAKMKGYCMIHYRTLSIDGPICSVPGCNANSIARGKCMRHYQQERRDHGGKFGE